MKPHFSSYTRVCVKKNKNHHLWKNGDVWWINYHAVPTTGGLYKSQRVRQSLHTKNLKEARTLRDAILK